MLDPARDNQDCKIEVSKIMHKSLIEIEKSARTVTHRSVSQLEARFTLLLTATPMIKLPMDLHGLLSLLWKPEYGEVVDFSTASH